MVLRVLPLCESLALLHRQAPSTTGGTAACRLFAALLAGSGVQEPALTEKTCEPLEAGAVKVMEPLASAVAVVRAEPSMLTV